MTIRPGTKSWLARIDAGGIDYTMGIRLPLPGVLQFLYPIAQDQLGAITRSTQS
jgi:hypothetical protein